MTTSSPSPVSLHLNEPLWIKSMKSSQGGNCVEMRCWEDAVEIRDSKDPTGPVLRLTGAGVADWLAGARSGSLDHLLG